MVKLKLGFRTDEMNIDYLTINDVREDIDLSEIINYANQIIEKDLMVPKQGTKYVTLESIEKNTTVIEILM